MCEAGIPWVQDPDKHYKNICKGIVEEAISISHLMIVRNTMSRSLDQVVLIVER